MRRLPVVLTVATALAVPIALAVPAVGAATAHQRPAVRIDVARNGHVEAPAHLRPGIAQLHASYKAIVGLAEPKHGTGSAAQVAHDFWSKNPHDLLRDYRIVTIFGPGSDEYTRLRRGIVYTVPLAGRHRTAADVAVTRVSGAVDNAVPPVSHRSVVSPNHLVHMPGSLPGAAWLHVENRSSSVAYLWTLRVGTKVPDAQVTRLLRHPNVRRFFAVEASSSGDLLTTSLGPNSSVWVPFERKSGRYVTALLPTGRGEHLRVGQVRETVVH